MHQKDLFLQDRRAVSLGVETRPELDQWLTPYWAAEELAHDVLHALGAVPVLEPSCGAGSFLSAIPDANEAYGVEIDPVMAERARRATGRHVIEGDFRSVDLPPIEFGAIIGNPPFGADTVDLFIRRCHRLLPDGGVAAFILPAHLFSTTNRVRPWATMFNLDVQMIPRSLFPRISTSLVWAKFIKARARKMIGLMLFDRQGDVESMPKEIRRRLTAAGTWREAVHHALESLNGEATLREIYAALEPRRPSENQWWRDKCRQTLRLHFERVDDRRWRLPSTLVA
ncbi:methyltransferase domain-containing protein [Sphingomonas sp. 3-13AW]|uniref:methyltransferase domain-containing protein n=1 Tax=Sphingomonas sp. 3-13AW TaxID=3050450 RepID=UPI003BB52ED1